MAIRVITFNGLGEPCPKVEDGCVLLLVQQDELAIVRLELLPPESFGPALLHAENSAALVDAARAALLEAFPAGLPRNQHWTVECPTNIAQRAVFRSVGISFGRLFCPSPADREEHPSVGANLTEDNHHIHGWLELRINGRVLPRMGFFGAAAVCINSWLVELTGIDDALEQDQNAFYVFDEAEQGAPLYRFRRDGSDLIVSIEHSLTSGATGEETWQGERCSFGEFQTEVQKFSLELRAKLEGLVGPSRAAAWWRDVTGSA